MILRAEEESSKLNDTLRIGMREINVKIGESKIVAVLNFQSGYKNVSEYIIDELTKHIVNDGLFKVVERQNLNALQTEIEYHLSGEVSDETARAIGRKLGAEIILSGSFSVLGRKYYRLIIRAISVETAEILAVQTAMIRGDALLNALINSDKTVTADSASWMYKRVYLGFRLGISPHLYHINTSFDVKPKPYTFIDGGAQISVYLADIFALQTEFIFHNDKVETEDNDISIVMPSFYVPLLAKATYRGGGIAFSAFGGPFLTVPIGDMSVKYNGQNHTYKAETPVGVLAGISAGIKTGPGLLFFDARFGADLVHTAANNASQYRRYILSFSLGYETGFIDR
jgi:hypothetical protein